MIMYVEREWGVTYTVRGMSLLMERLGLSYTRPTYTLAKADPEKQRVFLEETFPDLKKTDGKENRSPLISRQVYDSRLPSHSTDLVSKRKTTDNPYLRKTLWYKADWLPGLRVG